MIRVYGNTQCSRCEITKRILSEKGIEFDYFLVEKDLLPEEKAKLLRTAEQQGFASFPIITKNGQFTTLQEVI